VIEFRSGDIASFWLLHTCSSAYAGLSHLFHHPGCTRNACSSVCWTWRGR
jgi:predicted component of type VI protein secretion system